MTWKNPCERAKYERGGAGRLRLVGFPSRRLRNNHLKRFGVALGPTEI
jgi:hypothetical protein